MSYTTVDIPKIVEELMDVLVKNDVPIKSLDNILEELKNTAYINTIIQYPKQRSRSNKRTIIKG